MAVKQSSIVLLTGLLPMVSNKKVESVVGGWGISGRKQQSSRCWPLSDMVPYNLIIPYGAG